jgi:multiple sugar transport system permease protein
MTATARSLVKPLTARPVAAPVERADRRPVVRTVVVSVLLAGCGLLFCYPFLWLVSASLKPGSQVFDNSLIPAQATFENYARVWTEAPLLLWLGNSLLIAVLAATSVTLSSAAIAWGFAHYRFAGNKLLFTLVLATMMLPGAVTLVPVYLVWNSVGLANTQLPLWAGNLFGSAFYIFLLRQFFKRLPRDLFEAARMDGAGPWRTFTRIALPLARPALIVTFLFEFEASWTDLMRPLVYLRNTEQFTVPRGLKALVDQFGFGGEMQWEIIVTASVLATIPMIVLFFLGQRHFLGGIATTGRAN